MDKVIICLSDNLNSVPQLVYAIDFCTHFNRLFDVILIQEETENIYPNDYTYLEYQDSPAMKLTNREKFHETVKKKLPEGVALTLLDYTFDLIGMLHEKQLRNEYSLLILPHPDKTKVWPLEKSLSQFLKKLDLPILLINGKSEFRPFTHAVYASNFLLMDVTVLNRFKKISDNEIKDIDVIHVSSSEGFQENLIAKGFEAYIRTNLPDLNIKMHCISSIKSQETVIEAFLTELNRYEPDLLIVMKEDKSGIEEFLSKSFTSAVAKEIDTPMLILHERYAQKKID